MLHTGKITAVLIILLISSAYAFNRDDYPHWIDADGDGQDTRQEILIRDSQVPATLKPDGNVETGLWVCPYTGRVIRNPSDIDVDHLVALGRSTPPAQVHGRWNSAPGSRTIRIIWLPSPRGEPLKRDKDGYLWLPPNIANCSWYLSARNVVWRKYGIEIDDDERKAVAFFREKCPLHEKGIKLNRVRRWLGTWFDGLF